MKQTSIEKLSEVYNYIKGNSWKLTTAEQAAAFIHDVIRAEASAPVKGSRFDIFNYVSKDALRPVMTGVYHEDGWRIASDLHIMIALNESYPEDYEHKILCKDGSFVKDGIYPKWRSILPDGKDYTAYEFDSQKFFDWLEQKRIERKTETGRGAKFAPEWKVKVGPCLLKAEFFDKVISAMKHIGATQLFVKDARRTVYAKTDKGTVLLMPVVTEEEETNTVTLA